VYTYIYIYIVVYTSLDNGTTFAYYNITESPLVISLEFVGEALYGEYTDLVIGGLGETYVSQIWDAQTVIAGTNSTHLFKITPYNIYS